MIEKGMFRYGTWNSPDRVVAAGGQIMNPLGLVKDIPVMILDRPMPVDLIVVPLKNHEVILGMDWLGKYRETLDCHRGRVKFENEFGPPIKFQGIKPTFCCLVVSAIQVERMLGNGCEAFLATIYTDEVVGVVTRMGYRWSGSSRMCLGHYRVFPLIGLTHL